MNLGFEANLTALHRGFLRAANTLHASVDEHLLAHSTILVYQPVSFVIGPVMIDKAALRGRMDALRQAKSTAQQQRAATALAGKLTRQPFFQRAQHIAAYIAINGELELQPLLHCASQLGKTLYLPVIQGKQLVFVHYQPGLTPLAHNRYGIPEPCTTTNSVISPTELDLVLTPLLAFDAAGRRLGTGGGFYDRTFAFKRTLHLDAQPLLLGVAHACQQVEHIPTDPWDVALKGVITDRHVFL